MRIDEIVSAVTERYDTSEGNREYFFDKGDWAEAVAYAGGDVIKQNGIYQAHGWEGLCGEFDPATGEGWLVDDMRRSPKISTEAKYRGREVPLNQPMRGDVKKSKVYVKDPKTGRVKKVNFGDPNMRIKKSNPKRRKSFRARHNCDNPGPKTKARFWSCKKW